MKKEIILIVILLLSVYQINAQSMQDPYNAVQLSDEFDQSQGRLTFYAENRDFCDYYLYISFIYSEGFTGMPKGTSITVRSGKWQVLNYKVQEGASGYGYNYKYAMYRGNADKQPNVDFAYSLPVAAGVNADARPIENRDGYQLEFTISNDTICACRGGIVCDDKLKDFTSKGYQMFDNTRNFLQISVYHADGTFGEYVFQGKSLVYPGQTVKMGAPIAIAGKSVTGDYQLRFSVYFLDKNKIKDNSSGSKHTHFRPFFQTDNYGKTRLESDKNYICEHTDEMLMQDMSKREKKSLLKNTEKTNQ
ncbi:MAG: M23 family metallopeptidase [Candidatus Azobacteroides sp.]|nr:M23 family metallopeptidase [Candidatus Azobacteroides sp.]